MFTCCIFCFEFVVFLLPSLFGLLDELTDCELSDPNCPLILGRDTELLRELTNREAYFISIYIFHILHTVLCWWVMSSSGRGQQGWHSGESARLPPSTCNISNTRDCVLLNFQTQRRDLKMGCRVFFMNFRCLQTWWNIVLSLFNQN